MKILLTIAIVLVLSGCYKPTITVSGELRREIFVECMELAAKNSRNGDDDVSDIVKACSAQSYHMAKQVALADESK